MSAAQGVSLIVLNLNGQEHLERLFGSLSALDYPREKLEILFLDNGSTDESVSIVRERYSEARVIEFGENLGFAAAMNRGAAEASNEILVFLNNDLRVEPDFLGHLVRPIEEGRADASAAKMLSWDEREVQFSRGGTNFHGIAFQHGLGEPDGPDHSVGGETLFGCGAALAIPAKLFLEVGGFDDGFFAYYEDVDLGWRLWVLGYTVVTVPEARVYHHHSATSLKIDLHKIRVLHLRNPMMMIFKNYEQANLEKVLPAALLLSARRTWYLSGVDQHDFRIGREVETAERRGLLKRTRARREYEEAMSVPKLVVSDLVAVNDIVTGCPDLVEKRAWIQERRKRADRDILPLFLDPFRHAEANPEYMAAQAELCRFFGIDEIFRAAGCEVESAKTVR